MYADYICCSRSTLIFSYAFTIQDLLSKAIANLVFFIWTHELLPLDILLLALIDRDDDHCALRIVVCFLPCLHSATSRRTTM